MSLRMARRPGAPILALLLLAVLSVGCTRPGDAAPVLKLGVIAPFEGAGRPLGYAILPAIKSAVADANASGKLSGYRVAVVALNDSLDPATAAQQAKALTLDPDVLAVVGPFGADTVASAQPVLAVAAIPNVPVIATSQAGGDYDEDVTAAKEAANAVLRALAADIANHGRPSRSGISVELVSP